MAAKLRKKKINFKHSLFQWISWLILVVIWNYGVPEAKPLDDVLVAVLLSLLFIIIKYLTVK